MHAAKLYVFQHGIPNSLEFQINEDQHFRSISKAVEASQNGDSIFIAGGIYFESVVIKNKTKLTLLPFNRSKVIISGAYKQIIAKSKSWTFLKKIKSKYTNSEKDVYVLDLEQNIDNWKLVKGDKYKYVYNRNNQPLWLYGNLSSFESQYLSDSKQESVCFNNSKIYLAVEVNKDPNLDRYFISKPQAVVQIINSSDILLDGGHNKLIEIRHPGRRAVLLNGRWPSTSENIIRNIRIFNGKIGITLAQLEGRAQVLANELIFYAQKKWCWSEIKNCHTYQEEGINCIAYMNSIGILDNKQTQTTSKIKGNKIRGYFNGIVILSDNAEVENNIIKGVMDDAIELEGHIGNIIIRKNFVDSSYRAISLAPITKGPIFIYENVFLQSNESYLLKFDYAKKKYIYSEAKLLKFWSQIKNDSIYKTENCHFYFNTFYALKNPLEIGGALDKMSPEKSSFFNNIFYSLSSAYNAATTNVKGVDLDNNIFTQNISGRKLSSVLNSKKNSNKGWEKNFELKIKFRIKNKISREDLKLKSSSKKKLRKISVKVINENWPGALYLNESRIPGAIQ